MGRIRFGYALQVHKVISTRGEGFLFTKSSMCTTCHSFYVTSRRGPPTSRRQFYISLSRRDVDLLHRDDNFHKPLPRRDVAPHVATLPCFKPKNGSFLALHLTHSTNQIPSFPAHQPSPDLPELPSHRSEVPPLLSDHLCASQSHPLQLVPGHCGIPTTLYSALALVGSSRVSLYSQLVQGPLRSKFRVFLGFRVLSHS